MDDDGIHALSGNLIPSSLVIDLCPVVGRRIEIMRSMLVLHRRYKHCGINTLLIDSETGESVGDVLQVFLALSTDADGKSGDLFGLLSNMETADSVVTILLKDGIEDTRQKTRVDQMSFGLK
jgi:hypothetical protein